MNCCNKNNKDNTSNNEEQNKMGIKHMLIMVLCCAIPITLLLVLPLLNIPDGRFSAILSMGIFLLCPLLHIGLMGVMMKKSKKHNEDC
ncbi:hypothetical protein EDC18_103273 [Natranaerovirga pectinivora]|uniref:DUF2933 family protein n=1 Tax=Natranaerovirga pectinivora TaxID=682400 RepID=A0A4R3MRZ4_9FIRM|nr:hypothetical protein [Natranaerovirga pectinivora]TCT15567.1 hypothetical protein EDC18_103273 [Natranaerovirga pectinivora]